MRTLAMLTEDQPLVTGFRLTYSTLNFNDTRHRIAPLELRSHTYKVRVTIKPPHIDRQRFGLPAWISGGYLMRGGSRRARIANTIAT
jgi:hypothetical protein